MPTRDFNLYFKGEKPVVVDIHPTHPWIVLCLKHDYHIIHFDYRDEVEIARFSLLPRLEQKRDDGELARYLSGDYSPSSPLSRNSKLGEVRDIFFYDNDVICWNVKSLYSRSNAELGASNINGRWIVVVCEFKVITFCLEAPNQFLELSSEQLDGRSVTATSPLYCVPVLALGCSDGFIRLWNHETNVVSVTKLTVPGGKNVSRILVLHPSDNPEKVYIVGAAESGTVVCFEGTNAASVRPSFGSVWILSKLHDGAVSDACYDYASGELATLSASGIVIVIQLATGKVLKKVRVGRKNAVPRQILLARTEKGTVKSQYLFPTRFTKILSSAQSLHEKTFQDLTEFVSAKKSVEIKIYSMAVHPVHPCLIFCCTNAGCYSFIISSDWEMPTHAMGYEEDNEAPFVDNTVVTAKDKMKFIVRTLYYLKDNKLYYRVIQPLTADAAGPARFSEEKESGLTILPSSLGTPCTGITVSPCGRYLALVNKDTATVEIRSCKTRQVINTNTVQGNYLVWHSHYNVFATTRLVGDRTVIAIHEINNAQSKVIQIVPSVDTIMPVHAIFGGRWLGIAYAGDRDHFQFYKWDGQSSVGGFLPRPDTVIWDRTGTYCALVYMDSIAVMWCQDKIFGPLCTIEIEARSAIWWNKCLIVDTWKDIVMLFPAKHTYDRIVLCTSEIQAMVTETGPASAESGGDLSLSGRLSSASSSRSSAISLADSRLQGISPLGSFSRRKKGMEETDPLAALPTPAPAGLPYRGARNIVPLRPKGLLQLVEVVDTTLYIMDGDSVLRSVSMNIPDILWRILGQSGRIKSCLLWQTHPDVNPMHLAKFIAERGHVDEALAMEGVTETLRLDIAIQNERLDLALSLLEAIPDMDPSARFDSWCGLAEKCTKANRLDLADTCCMKAAEIEL